VLLLGFITAQDEFSPEFNFSVLSGTGKVRLDGYFAAKARLMNNPSITLRAKRWLKQFPQLVKLKRGFVDSVQKRDLELCEAMPLFAPNSGGSPSARAKLTVLSANQTFPFLGLLLNALGEGKLECIEAKDFADTPEEIEAAIKLKEAFEFHKSDKSSEHNYHFIYAKMLKDRKSITAMLEIGLGTNNPDVVSSMGILGTPGASIRAFRDFLPQARIYGADVDRGILFEEDRIKTFFVDQTDLKTLDQLGSDIPGELDLIIDDGLHSPNANLAVLLFALKKLKVGGWLAIEDIHEKAYPVWVVVASLLPASYKASMISAQGALVFAVQRLE
jgi:hypothetical protein